MSDEEIVNEESGDAGDAQRSMRADARRNRSRVLEACRRLLSTKTADELSMEEVAREADIGKGTLYRHYPNKELLMEALITEVSQRISNSMREEIPPEADAATKLRLLVQIVYALYEEYGLSIDLMLSTYFVPTMHGSKKAKHPLVPLMGRLRGILEQGVREGLFRPLDLDYATYALISALSPIAFVRQRQYLGYERDDLSDRLIDFLLHALKAQPVSVERRADD